MTIEEHYEWEPEWLTKEEMEIVMGLFLYDRGKDGATETELFEVYEWAEQTRMNQYMLDHLLEGMFIPVFVDGPNGPQFGFKITEKGEKMALEVLKGDMGEPKARFLATKALESETGMNLSFDKSGKEKE